MSLFCSTKVWEHYPRGGTHKLVLLSLADWADDEGGRVFPSNGAVARKCGISRPHAVRILRDLVVEGYLAIVANSAGGAPGATKQYRLVLEQLTGSPDGTGKTDDTGIADDTGSAGDTGIARDKGGVSPVLWRGIAGDTQTVINHQGTVNTGKPRAKAPVASPAVDPCPHEQIVDSYHRALPMCPRVRLWTKARRTALATRWREDPARQQLAWWTELFGYVAQSEFLTGHAQTAAGRPPFLADLEWLIRPANLVKVIEGKYHGGPA
jgi:hypothetical protein